MAARSNLPPRNIQLPTVPPGIQDILAADTIRRLSNAIEAELNSKVTRNMSEPYFMLTSPNGTVYKVVVDDAGALSTVPF